MMKEAGVMVDVREDSPVITLDCRGVEPPQPMIMILEQLVDLAPGREVWALTDRRPMFLYSELELRGFSGVTRELSDGSHVTCIQHR